MKTFTDKYLQWILLGLISCTMVILTIISEGYFGGADNINHYFISHYSFQYHLLFFDSWGRPSYTILSSPFAQFGFLSVKLLNVFFGMCTAFFAFLIAKRLDIKPSYLVIIFVVFTPIYCVDAADQSYRDPVRFDAGSCRISFFFAEIISPQL